MFGWDERDGGDEIHLENMQSENERWKIEDFRGLLLSFWETAFDNGWDPKIV